MGDRPILTLKKKAPVALAAPGVAPVVEAKPLSPQKLASLARAEAAAIEHQEKAAAIALARPIFESHFRSLLVVQQDRPLAINVFYAFRDWLRDKPVAVGFSNSMLRRTIEPIIAEHVERPVYLAAVINELHRYHPDGSVSELVDENHKSGAFKKLEKLEKKAIKRIERMKTMDRDEAIKLLDEALNRLKNPSNNANGKPCQVGGVYWRLAKVLEKHVEPLLDEFEGEHADFLRKNHGVITRPEQSA